MLQKDAPKREIVAASLVPGTSVSSVARHYDLNANMVFSWRKRFAEIPEASSPPFVPVVVTRDAPMATAPTLSGDMIEIELPRGYRVRLGGRVKAATLRLVLDALERR